MTIRAVIDPLERWAGHVDPARYVQIGLRGYRPGEAEFAWQRERGITASS